VGTKILNQSDPTDHALAAIASILDGPEPDRAPEKAILQEKPDTWGRIEADGYSKVGPGPIAAIRFKWTVRRESDGQYFVDETVGDNSRPVSNGPMSADAATRFVDDRERQARQRFETLKNEMNERAAAANVAGKDGGEI
jgi:hypothetical protein